MMDGIRRSDELFAFVPGSLPCTAINMLHARRDGFHGWSLFICSFTSKVRRKKRLHPLIYERRQNVNFHTLKAHRKAYVGKLFESNEYPSVRLSVLKIFHTKANYRRSLHILKFGDRRMVVAGSCLASRGEESNWNEARCLRLRETWAWNITVRNASKIFMSGWPRALISVDGVPYKVFTFAPGEIPLGIHWIGALVDPKVGLKVVKREISWSCLESNTDTSVMQPVSWSIYQLSYPGSYCHM
jgi:hypothetical protein